MDQRKFMVSISCNIYFLHMPMHTYIFVLIEKKTMHLRKKNNAVDPYIIHFPNASGKCRPFREYISKTFDGIQLKGKKSLYSLLLMTYISVSPTAEQVLYCQCHAGREVL